ncbi:MAG: autoinducer binding domain-containing protein [Rhodobacteraceae bacterium]|nr:autoinducer binding domain-containing protein [Paracoccaceae bacterium]
MIERLKCDSLFCGPLQRRGKLSQNHDIHPDSGADTQDGVLSHNQHERIVPAGWSDDCHISIVHRRPLWHSEDQQLIALEASFLAAEIDHCENCEELMEALGKIASYFDVDQCWVVLAHGKEYVRYRYRLITMWPLIWRKLYTDRCLSKIDPILQRSALGPGTYFFDEIDLESPIAESYMAALREHTTANSGICCTARTDDGDLVALCLSSSLAPHIFRKKMSSQLPFFIELATHAADIFSRVSALAKGKFAAINDTEWLLLRAYASGADSREASDSISHISNPDLIHNSLLRHLCARSITHAVAIAIANGLLRDNTVFSSDILPGLESGPRSPDD